MGITLGIIGAGNMGMAILRGALDAGVLSPQTTVVSDVEPARREEAAGQAQETQEQTASRCSTGG